MAYNIIKMYNLNQNLINQVELQATFIKQYKNLVVQNFIFILTPMVINNTKAPQHLMQSSVNWTWVMYLQRLLNLKIKYSSNLVTVDDQSYFQWWVKDGNFEFFNLGNGNILLIYSGCYLLLTTANLLPKFEKSCY